MNDQERPTIVPINGAAPDYYQWGANCRKLRLTQAQAEDIIHQDVRASSDDHDMFWYGYDAARSE